MATFPDTAPIPVIKPGPGRFPDPPLPPGPGGGGGPGGIVKSFTQPAGGDGMTLQALMQRQKEAAARGMQNLQQPQGTILGGLGQMANAVFAGLEERRAAKDEAAGREEIVQAMMGIDPATGMASPEQLATIMRRDPDLGLALYQQAMQARQDAANQDDWVDMPAPEGSKPGTIYQRNTKTNEIRTAGSGGLTIDTGTDSKMSDWAAEDAKFYMQGSMANLDLEDWDTELASTPGALAQFATGSTYLNSPEYKKARIAGDSWIMSVLRPESGGVIGEEEMQEHRQTYLPQPGETAEVIEYKRELRRQKTEQAAFGVKATAPNTWTEMQAVLEGERAVRAQRRRDRQNPPAPDDDGLEVGDPQP